MNTTFTFMRQPHETPDPISQAIANIIGAGERAGYSIAAGPDPVPMLTFWSMKQSGEIAPDEMVAVWLVLMRHIDAGRAAHCVVEHCMQLKYTYTPQEPMSTWAPALRQLWEVRGRYLNAFEHPPRLPFLTKLRTALCEALRHAACVRDNTMRVASPLDTWALLSACEVALKVADEEGKRRWRMVNH